MLAQHSSCTFESIIPLPDFYRVSQTMIPALNDQNFWGKLLFFSFFFFFGGGIFLATKKASCLWISNQETDSFKSFPGDKAMRIKCLAQGHLPWQADMNMGPHDWVQCLKSTELFTALQRAIFIRSITSIIYLYISKLHTLHSFLQ